MKSPLHSRLLANSSAAIAEPHRLLLHDIFSSVQVLGLTASPGGDVDVVSFFHMLQSDACKHQPVLIQLLLQAMML